MILLVGNGSSVLDEPLGDLVDSFDHVVRFNSFKTKGLEEWTGIKTDTWFTCNLCHIKNSFKEIIWHSWEKDENKDKNFAKLKSKHSHSKKLSREIIDQAIEQFPRGIDYRSPSTGLLAIFYFLTKAKKVCLHGFDWWSRSKHHYADNEIRGTLHKPEIEMRIICNLIFSEKVTFLDPSRLK